MCGFKRRKTSSKTLTLQLHRCMKKRSFSALQEILPEAVWLHRLVDAFRLLCWISAAGFQEETRDETTERQSAVQLCSSLLNPLLFHNCFKNMWDVKPSNQPGQETTNPADSGWDKDIVPLSLCGWRQHHMRLFAPAELQRSNQMNHRINLMFCSEAVMKISCSPNPHTQS